jgi:predicted nucleic-acid-binding protein
MALDTNFVVRLLVRDEPAQTDLAAAAVRGQQVLLTTSVLLETEWVLRACYRVPREAIARALRQLVDLDGLTLDQPATARQALDGFEAGLDFADAPHLAASRAASEFVTFDRKLARQAAALGLSPRVRLCG